MSESKARFHYQGYDIIRSQVVTEKSTSLSEKNVVTFDVLMSTTKPEIKRAVEHLFNVEVHSVNTLIRKGKQKVFKGRIGQRSDIKRAYVRLKSGHSVDLHIGG